MEVTVLYMGMYNWLEGTRMKLSWALERQLGGQFEAKSWGPVLGINIGARNYSHDHDYASRFVQPPPIVLYFDVKLSR